jgi:hypothetical protein
MADLHWFEDVTIGPDVALAVFIRHSGLRGPEQKLGLAVCLTGAHSPWLSSEKPDIWERRARAKALLLKSVSATRKILATETERPSGQIGFSYDGGDSEVDAVADSSGLLIFTADGMAPSIGWTRGWTNG